MADLLELAERCEAATGPDRELGREVLLACGWSKTLCGHVLGPLYSWSPPGPYRPGSSFDDDRFHHHDPTSSLDAAMTLVPEGWAVERWSIWPGEPSHLDLLETRQVGDQWVRGAALAKVEATAATPALALCAAALRAREQS